MTATPASRLPGLASAARRGPSAPPGTGPEGADRGSGADPRPAPADYHSKHIPSGASDSPEGCFYSCSEPERDGGTGELSEESCEMQRWLGRGCVLEESSLLECDGVSRWSSFQSWGGVAVGGQQPAPRTLLQHRPCPLQAAANSASPDRHDDK